MEEEKKVTISKDLFESLQKRVEKQEKDIKVLMQTTDRKRMSLYWQRHKEDIPTIIKVRKIDKKVVLGWRTVKNEVYKDALTQKWIEKQDVEVLYEDSSKEEMSLLDFNRRFEYIKCKRLGVVTNDKTGSTAFKLARLDNGNEITIADQFVN